MGGFVLFLFKLHQFVLPAWGVTVVFPLITLPGEIESRAEGLVPYCHICVNISLKLNTNTKGFNVAPVSKETGFLLSGHVQRGQVNYKLSINLAVSSC